MLKKLILIAGPTGSGKSTLAIHLAKKLDGEIINAEVWIYKEFWFFHLDLQLMTKKIKHHLYGFISVKKHFSW